MQRNENMYILIFCFRLCRFIFCRGVFALHSKFRDKPGFLPRCCPALPDEVLPNTQVVESMVFYLASSVGVADQFEFPASFNRSGGSDILSNKTPSVQSIVEDFNHHGLGGNWGGTVVPVGVIQKLCPSAANVVLVDVWMNTHQSAGFRKCHQVLFL